LDQTLAELGKIDADLSKKVEDLGRLLDAEVSAKRVTDPIAQSLRWSLRNLQPSSGSDFGAIVGSSRLPVENASLMEAIKGLETQWAAAQQQRNALIQAGLAEARLRVTEAAQSAGNAADVDPLIATLTQLQEAAQNRNAPVASLASASNYTSLLAFTRALRRVVELTPKSDPLNVSSALAQLQYSTTSIRTYIDDSVVQQRIQKMLAPYQKAQEEAQAALDTALGANKPASELATALAQFEEAVERQQQARSGLNLRGPRDISDVTNTYRNLVALAGARESGDFNRVRSLTMNLKESNLQHLGTTRAATYSAQIAAWEKDLDAQRRQADEKRREALGKRVSAVQNPAELDVLAAELARAEAETRNDRDSDLPRGIAQQLRALAAAWTGANPQFLQQSYIDSADTRFSTELTGLRQRIERDVLAKSLRAPELNQPPLASLAPDAALDKLSGQFAASGEWRRLLQLTEARGLQNRFTGLLPRDSDLTTALHSYLAAQNFELAEQWSDAVQSYKLALRSTSELAPIKESADRLKALAKSHPEAFPAPAATTPLHARVPLPQ